MRSLGVQDIRTLSLCLLPSPSTKIPITSLSFPTPLPHLPPPTNSPTSTKQPNTTASPNPKAAKRWETPGTLLHPRLLILSPLLPLSPSPFPLLPLYHHHYTTPLQKPKKKLTPPTRQDLERQIHPQRSISPAQFLYPSPTHLTSRQIVQHLYQRYPFFCQWEKGGKGKGERRRGDEYKDLHPSPRRYNMYLYS